MKSGEESIGLMLHDILGKTSIEKRRNTKLFIEVAVEVVKRCPYLTEIPVEEQEELINILKEKNII